MFINETWKYVNNNTENTDSPCVLGVGTQAGDGSGKLQGGLCEERLDLIQPDTAIRHLQTHCRAQLSPSTIGGAFLGQCMQERVKKNFLAASVRERSKKNVRETTMKTLRPAKHSRCQSRDSPLTHGEVYTEADCFLAAHGANITYSP